MNKKIRGKVFAMTLCVALLFQAVNPIGLSALVNDEVPKQSTEEMQEESSAVENEATSSVESSSSEETKAAEESSSSEETKSAEESSSVEGSSVEDSLSNESSVSEESSEVVESSSVIEENSAVEESSTEEISEVEETESETETKEESEILELGADETGEPDVEGFVEAVIQGFKNRDAIIENLEQYNIPNAMAEEMYYGIINDNPDLYYVKPGSFYGPGEPIQSIYVDYYDDVDNDDGYWQGKQNVLSIVTSDMSDLQKTIVLHDWIITHTDYDYDAANRHLNNKAHSAYGVFVDGLAVCQGMSLAYKSLLDEIGIENYIVEGKSGGGPHAWNVLVIDGEYYHVDITQDNSDTSDTLYPRIGHDVFLVNNNNGVFSFTHTDYYMHKDYQEMNVPATSTTYDNAFWRSVYSPITAANGLFYYIENNILYKTSSYDSSSESIKITDVKTVSESSVSYSGLFRMNDRIYFNDKYAVYSIALDGTDKRAEYQITDTTNGYISGVDRTGDQVYIELYKDGNFTKSNVTLAGSSIELQPMEIGFDNSEEDIYKNDTLQLNLKTYPGGDISSITWTSDNTAVATVSDSGLVTPVTTGTAKITAEWNSMKAECTVTVKENSSSEEQHYVIFREPNGDFISSCYANDGCDAPLPDFSAPDGYSLSWTENYINIKKNETVMAIFTPIEYDIIYELDGGANAADNPPKYTIETDDIMLVSPTKNGATFDGWYYESSFTTKVDVISKGSTGDITLYAKWIAESSNKYLVTFKAPDGTVLKEEQVEEGHDATLPEYSAPNGYNITWNGNYTNVRQDETVTAVLTPIEYNITYELDGGTNATANPSTYTVEAEDITFASPTKNGMTFDGWYYDHEYTIRVDILAKGSYGNITLYAKWTTESSNKYLVTFKAPDGTVLKEEQVTEDHDATLPEYSAPNGYNVTWNGNYTNVRQDETVTAVLTPIEYNITYELDGGINASGNPSKYTIETENITLVSPTKDGMTFDGWYCESSFTTKVDVISKGSTGDITLYAKWIAESSNKYLVTFKAPDGTVLKEEQVEEGHDATLPEYSAPNGYNITWNGNYTNVRQDETVTAVLTPIEYNITYELDGGTNATANPSTYTVEAEDITFASPTKNGMTFDGWYYDHEYTIRVDILAKGSYGNITLYAKWTTESSNKYLVTFKAPDGTVLKEEQVTEDHDATLPEYSAPNGYNVTWNGNYTNVRQDETVTAVLTPIEYNITYELDGGINASGNPSKYTIETENITLVSPTKDGMIFDGWYYDSGFVTKVDIISKGSYGDITLYAKWFGKNPEDNPNYKNGLWTEEIRDVYYTGSAIKPVPVVYDGMTRLASEKDYSVAYKNNTNAGTAQVIITGKGNYKGKVTAEFKIIPVDIKTASVYDMSVMYKSGKKQTPVPVVELNGKKLKNKKDFSVAYQGSCIEPGEYDVTISGTGNYTGTRQIKLVIASGSEMLISKASVSKIPDVAYTGNPVVINESSVTVKYKGKVLENGTDYEIQYGTCIDSGAYDLLVVGKGQYKGIKTVKFNIKGTAIKKASMAPLTVPYTGTAQTPDINLTFEGKTLVYETDYITTFENNVNKGKATVRITGMGRFSGTVTKTFNITAQPISAAEITFNDNSNSFPYAKGGTVPEITVKCNGNILRKGVDYTVTGKNNQKLGNAALIVKGIGNYSGTVSKNFTVTAQDIAKVLLMLPDVEYTGRKGGYKTKPVLMDTSGKKLSTSDYDKNIIYKDATGNILDKNSVVNTGDVISVTIKGKGNYSGEITGTYRIIPKGRNIAKAKQDKIVKEYTGKEIVLSKEEISLSIGGNKIPSDGFEIVPGSYVNNINKGTASVTVRGVGEYGGIKTITFKIDMQNLKWGK